MRHKNTAALAVITVLAAGVVAASDMETEIEKLAETLGKRIAEKQADAKVAVTTFLDLQSNPTELGLHFAESLSVEMVNVNGLTVIDRTNLKAILNEHKLTEEGLVNKENAKKLGEFAGVNVLVSGKITAFAEEAALNVIATSIETSTVIASGKARFKMSQDLMKLLSKGVQGGAAGNVANPAPAGGATVAWQNPNGIASKNIGDLNFTLIDFKRVGVTISDGWRNKDMSGFQCTIVVKNTNLNQPAELTIAGRTQQGAPPPKVSLSDSALNAYGIVGAVEGMTMAYLDAFDSRFGDSDLLRALPYPVGKNVDKELGGSYSSVKWLGAITKLAPNEETEMIVKFVPNDSERVKPTGGGTATFSFSATFVVAEGEGQGKQYKFKTLSFDGIALPENK